MIKKRQAEGIAKAKAKSVYAKRKGTVNPDKIKQLLEDGLTKAAIAKQLILAACVFIALCKNLHSNSIIINDPPIVTKKLSSYLSLHR